MPAVVTKRCGNVKGRPLAVYVAGISFTGTYVVGGTEPCDLSGLGLGITLDEIHVVQGQVTTAAARYDVVYTKGTTMANGTLKLFLGGAELTGIAVTSIGGHLILYTGRAIG